MIDRKSGSRAAVPVLAAVALSVASPVLHAYAAANASSPVEAAASVVSTPKPASLSIEPGQWRFTTNTFSPFAKPKPARIVTKCISDPELTPEAFAAEAKGCSVHSVHADGGSLSWRMRCVGDSGSTMSGGASFTTTGTMLTGTLTMKMQIAGREADMKTIWDGERVGDCPAPTDMSDRDPSE